MLPASIKKQLSPMLQNGFVLKRLWNQKYCSGNFSIISSNILVYDFVIKRAVFQQCLELYPMTEWEALMQKMNKLNRFKKKNNDFIRRFTAGVKMVEVDSAGRLLIPKDLMLFSDITKDIVVSSAINIIEIWDKQKYEQAIDDATVDFADLAEDVMGQDDDNNGLS